MEIPLNITEFIEHPQILNNHRQSEWQRAMLKSLYGLPLSEKELAIYRVGTGREQYDAREQRELTAIAGRRSGKTTEIAAPIVLFEAFRYHGLTPGEEAYVILLAPQISQARIAFRCIRNYLRDSCILWKRVVSMTKNEIKLDNGIIIACYPCSYIAVRGLTIVAAICDEMAFWRHLETSANPEQEILAALRPGMATVRNPKLVKISSPYTKEGLLWEEFQRRGELDFPVWQAPTAAMNPSIPSVRLAEEQRLDAQTFRREYLAEFSEDITRWIEPEVLESCIVRNRRELPRVEAAFYLAAIDPAFVHSDFALAIAHRSSDGTVVLDRIAHWTGTKKAPVPYEAACQKIAEIATQYGIRKVVGDQYCATIIKQDFDKLGISYCEHAFGTHTRAELFGNLRHLLVQRKIELLDETTLVRQLRALEERSGPNGNIDIRPGYGQKDDVAVVVALAAFELVKRPPKPRHWDHVLALGPRYEGSIGRHERGWIPIGDWRSYGKFPSLK